MTKLLDIQAEIMKLQKQAAEIRTRELKNTILEIRQKMQAFGISVKDLQVKSTKGMRTSPVKTRLKIRVGQPKKNPVVAAKYRGPNGEVWSGRGLTPKWLKAQIDSGVLKDQFLISN